MTFCSTWTDGKPIRMVLNDTLLCILNVLENIHFELNRAVIWQWEN